MDAAQPFDFSSSDSDASPARVARSAASRAVKLSSAAAAAAAAQQATHLDDDGDELLSSPPSSPPRPARLSKRSRQARRQVDDDDEEEEDEEEDEDEDDPFADVSSEDEAVRGGGAVRLSKRRKRLVVVKPSRREAALRSQFNAHTQHVEVANVGELVGKAWRMCACSALFGLSFEARAFDIYASELALSLQRRMNQPYRSGVRTLDARRVLIFAVPCALDDNPDDLQRDELRRLRKACGAMVLCQHSEEDDAAGVAGGSSRVSYSYPLLLLLGKSVVTDIMVAWLTRRFDCHVDPLQLSSFVLFETFAKAVRKPFAGVKQKKSGSDKREHRFQLQVAPPAHIKHLDSINLRVTAASLANLNVVASAVHETAIVDAFYAHFRSYFRIDLRAMSVTQFATPHYAVQTSGRLKLLRYDSVPHVLDEFIALADSHAA